MWQNWMCYTHNSEQKLNHELVLKKDHKVVKFTQNAWLNPYIDMNTGIR